MAVMDTGNHRYVFLQTEPGTFVPREITLGFQGEDLVEVTSGLKAGDQVVDGADFLIDADSKLKAAFSEEK
jgi:Cu(I)/Ag(I) efflux system membrane fusion protein